MEVKGDYLRVQAVDYDLETGDKLEPEQKPAERIYTTDAPISGHLDGQVQGSIPVSIARQGTVAEFANQARGQCMMCKHFDQRNWQKLKAVMENSLEGQNKLRAIRAQVLFGHNGTDAEQLHDLSQGIDGDMDLDHAMNFLGFCRIYTEILRDEVLVTPVSTCHQDDCPPSNPMGFFDPKDRDNDRMGSAIYDDLMRISQNKYK